MTTEGQDPSAAAREAGRAAHPGAMRAGIYTRMSLARMDDQTKVADQERICRSLAEARGAQVADDCVYTDNNKSAWQPDRKRPGWDRMLADVEAGRIDAIIVYHGDRLIRQPMDLEKLLELARGKGVRLLAPTGERDLDGAEDQFILSIEAAMARRESANISRRQKARYDRDRRNGKVMAQGRGGRRFGFCADGVTPYPADRCEVASRREVSEADVIREMAARTLAGESANAIETDLTRRGWRTPAGSRLEHGALKRLLGNPRYAGLMPDGETRAAWEPVLDRETWERARLAVQARAAAHPRAARPARHLLSGIAVCACGKRMQIAYISSRGYRSVLYACSRRDTGGCGKVYRNAAHLDAYVSARVVARLSSPRNPDPEVPAEPSHAAEWAALAGERAATEALLADYAASPGNARLLLARLESVDARLADLRAMDGASQRDRLLGRYQGITREGFTALPLDVRRALVTATYRVTVLPASGRGPGFRTEDVELDPL